MPIARTQTVAPTAQALAQLKELARDPETHAKLLTLFDRIPAYDGAKNIHCPFPKNHKHGDTRKSAVAHQNNNGELVITCHACGFTLTAATLFKCLKLGHDPREVRNLRGREHAMWTTRLFLRADIIESSLDLPMLPADLGSWKHRGLSKDPDRARALLQKTRAGLEELFQIHLYWFGRIEKTTASARFLAQWVGGMTRNEALALRDKLIALGIITTTGEGFETFGRVSPYLFPGADRQPETLKGERQMPVLLQEPQTASSTNPAPEKKPANSNPDPIRTDVPTLAEKLRQEEAARPKTLGEQMRALKAARDKLRYHKEDNDATDIRRIEREDGTVEWWKGDKRLR